MRIEFHRLMVGIVLAGLNAGRDDAIYAVCAAGENIGDTDAFAALTPAALNLMGCHRAAPEKSAG